jgi:CheY-like chemotaxis protein
MPGISGQDALIEIRDAPGPNQDVPILAFTADADLSQLGLEHGFDGLVAKPVMAADLVEAVDRFTCWNGAGHELDPFNLAEA